MGDVIPVKHIAVHNPLSTTDQHLSTTDHPVCICSLDLILGDCTVCSVVRISIISLIHIYYSLWGAVVQLKVDNICERNRYIIL